MVVGPCLRVELFREPGKSLGISIVGGRGMGSRLSNGEVMRGIFIKHILEDSPAGQNGTLKTGDRIVEVKTDFRELMILQNKKERRLCLRPCPPPSFCFFYRWMESTSEMRVMRRLLRLYGGRATPSLSWYRVLFTGRG